MISTSAHFVRTRPSRSSNEQHHDLRTCLSGKVLGQHGTTHEKSAVRASTSVYDGVVTGKIFTEIITYCKKLEVMLT